MNKIQRETIIKTLKSFLSGGYDHNGRSVQDIGVCLEIHPSFQLVKSTKGYNYLYKNKKSQLQTSSFFDDKLDCLASFVLDYKE